MEKLPGEIEAMIRKTIANHKDESPLWTRPNIYITQLASPRQLLIRSNTVNIAITIFHVTLSPEGEWVPRINVWIKASEGNSHFEYKELRETWWDEENNCECEMEAIGRSVEALL